MNIEELADFPAMEKLAQALWRKGTARGAAVMVGAGFSRNALRPGDDTPKPPLWSGLANDLACELYRHPEDAPRDPLRLAEEYRTNFGQTALDEFVRTRIRDLGWEPSSLHTELLDLPWSDVLTTNWDTLLERTTSGKRWSVVRSPSDLMHGGGGRIIKLHGTVGFSEHFVFTEEDYRIYPTRNAAFVNTARQIFIENELCLLGFSGDDPNFLQWSGWVRDHLGDNARRIYLVGVLNLHPAKRKFLESRNIAPIDLAAWGVGDTFDELAAVATSRFLRYLKSAKPKPASDWNLELHMGPGGPDDYIREFKDPSYAASLLDRVAQIWRNERISYPGWVVCPFGLRRKLRFDVQQSHLVRANVLDKFAQDRKAEILYEFAWRRVVSLDPLDPSLEELLTSISDPSKPCALKKTQQLEIALAILRSARCRGDDDSLFRWAALIETNSAEGTDIRAQVAYQRALRARDRLDYRKLRDGLKLVVGPDPVWNLRRAALHCELGEFGEAKDLILSSYEELLRRYRLDPDSLWVISRLAWADWLSGASSEKLGSKETSPRETIFRQMSCDAETELTQIRDHNSIAVRKRLEKNVQIFPQFEAGAYKNPSNKVHVGNDFGATHLQELNGLLECVGLPIYLDQYDILGQSKEDAGSLGYGLTVDWYVWYLRTLHSSRDESLEKYLGRVAVARLPKTIALDLFDIAFKAVNFWREYVRDTRQAESINLSFALERFRLFIEVVARLAPRQESAVAIKAFRLAAEITQDSCQHYWLIDPLANLAKFSAEAVTPNDRPSLILDALEWPLSVEKNFSNFSWQWPNPIGDQTLGSTAPKRSDADLRWANRVAELIQHAGPDGASRGEAIIRLAYLDTYRALSAAERSSFSSVLWSNREQEKGGLPIGTRILAPILLQLPYPEDVDIDEVIRAYLFNYDIGNILPDNVPPGSIEITNSQNRLNEIAIAGTKGIRPTPRQAIILFDRMTRWIIDSNQLVRRNDPIGMTLTREFEATSKRLICVALAQTIVPSIPRSQLNEIQAKALMTCITRPNCGRAVAALTHYFGLTDALDKSIIQSVRRGLMGRTFDDVAGSTVAVVNWAKMYNETDPLSLPEQIIEQIISAVEVRHGAGLHSLIWGIRKILSLREPKEEYRTRLDEALGDLLVETEYLTVPLGSREATSVSLVRAECAKLARVLTDFGAVGTNSSAWLRAAEVDALPEVRFALSDAS